MKRLTREVLLGRKMPKTLRLRLRELRLRELAAAKQKKGAKR